MSQDSETPCFNKEMQVNINGSLFFHILHTHAIMPSAFHSQNSLFPFHANSHAFMTVGNTPCSYESVQTNDAMLF